MTSVCLMAIELRLGDSVNWDNSFNCMSGAYQADSRPNESSSSCSASPLLPCITSLYVAAHNLTLPTNKRDFRKHSEGWKKSDLFIDITMETCRIED